MGGVRWLFVAAPLACVSASTAFAQGGQSLSGVVFDTAGGVIPGAVVVVKNNATGVSFEAVTNEAGAFSVPALAGHLHRDRLAAGLQDRGRQRHPPRSPRRPASIKVKLEVGALTETVEVKAGSTLVQTQSDGGDVDDRRRAVSRSCRWSRATRCTSPAFLPGVETAGGPRGATISGLPNNTVNITIDGISTGNALQSTDGFFSMVTPRLDAVEEITVTGATPGAGGGLGRGADRVHDALGHQRRSTAASTTTSGTRG